MSDPYPPPDPTTYPPPDPTTYPPPDPTTYPPPDQATYPPPDPATYQPPPDPGFPPPPTGDPAADQSPNDYPGPSGGIPGQGGAGQSAPPAQPRPATPPPQQGRGMVKIGPGAPAPGAAPAGLPGPRALACAVIAVIAIVAVGGLALRLIVHPTSTSSAATYVPPTGGGRTSPNISLFPLDPAVAMPPGFPSDFPLYSGARPTYAVKQPIGSRVDYVVILETKDSAAKVATFYQSAFAQGRYAPTQPITNLGPFAVNFVTKTTPMIDGSITVEPGVRFGGTEITINLIVQ